MVLQSLCEGYIKWITIYPFKPKRIYPLVEWGIIKKILNDERLFNCKDVDNILYKMIPMIIIRRCLNCVTDI
jgi:hypothetical protein